MKRTHDDVHQLWKIYDLAVRQPSFWVSGLGRPRLQRSVFENYWHRVLDATAHPQAYGLTQKEIEEQVVPLLLNDMRERLADAGAGVLDLNTYRLEKLDLRRALLRGANLKGAWLRDADLTGADVRGASLQGVDMVSGRCNGMMAADADCRGANASGAMLVDADFSGALIQGMKLTYAVIGGRTFLDREHGRQVVGLYEGKRVMVLQGGMIEGEKRPLRRQLRREVAAEVVMGSHGSFKVEEARKRWEKRDDGDAVTPLLDRAEAQIIENGWVLSSYRDMAPDEKSFATAPVWPVPAVEAYVDQDISPLQR